MPSKVTATWVHTPRGMMPPCLSDPEPLRYERSVGWPPTLHCPIHQVSCQRLPAMLRQSSPVVLLLIATQASTVKLPVMSNAAASGTLTQPLVGSPVSVNQASNGCARATPAPRMANAAAASTRKASERAVADMKSLLSRM